MLYPALTLQDIYKSFFQDEFGPGHLLEDTAGARKYLEYELFEMTSRGNYTTEPCGTGMNFYRVPMDLVKDGKVSFEDYFSAFLESASTFRIPETEIWQEKWYAIISEIEKMNVPIKDFETEKARLEEMLQSGETVVHHSSGYTERYNPHYRIIGVKQWEKLKESYPDL